MKCSIRTGISVLVVLLCALALLVSCGGEGGLDHEQKIRFGD